MFKVYDLPVSFTLFNLYPVILIFRDRGRMNPGTEGVDSQEGVRREVLLIS